MTPHPDWLWGPPTPLSNGYWGPFRGVKWLAHEAEHSPPSSAKVRECMDLYITPPICLHGVVLCEAQGQLITSWCMKFIS